MRSKISSQLDALRLNTKRAHIAAMLLIIISLVLLPWILFLGTTLRDKTVVSDWSTTWVGLDVAQVIGLIVTAYLLIRRHLSVTIAATFTATLFLTDAWFDVMLARSTVAYHRALILAVLFEIPISIMCVWIALKAPKWCSAKK